MTRLSVNINKIATLRNSRGGNNPDLLKVALDCERFGAEVLLCIQDQTSDIFVTKTFMI